MVRRKVRVARQAAERLLEFCASLRWMQTAAMVRRYLARCVRAETSPQAGPRPGVTFLGAR